MPRLSRNKDNGWAKHYLNGDTYEALDTDVASGNKSWRKSALSGMAGVSLIHDGVDISIKGVGNFWQSDLLEAEVILNQTVAPLWVSRRISKQIEVYDRYINLSFGITKNSKIFTLTKEPILTNDSFVISIANSNSVGQWFVVSINPDNLEVSWNISKEKI